MKRSGLIGSAMLLLTAVIWGFAFVMQDRASEYVGEYTLTCTRYVIAAIFLIPCIMLLDMKTDRRLFNFRRGAGIGITRRELLGGAVCGIFLTAASVLQQIGIADTGAGVAGFITSLYVVIVPILYMLFGRKTSAKNWLCAILAVFGVFLISYTGSGFSSGDIFVLLCAFVFAMHIIAIDFVSPGCDGVRLSLIQFATGAVITLPFMLIIERPSVSDILSCAGPILYMGIMSSGVAYTLQILGQKRTAPAVACVIMSLESVFAAIGGRIVGGEILGEKKLLGCAVVFASVIITQIDFRAMLKGRLIAHAGKSDESCEENSVGSAD